MTIVGGANNIGTTSADIVLGERAADGTIDLQLAVNPRFEFCVCPIINVPNAATFSYQGLNAGTTYYARARARRASGAVDGWQANPHSFTTSPGLARVTAPASVMIEPALLVTPVPITATRNYRPVAGYPIENAFRDSPAAFRMTEVYAGGGYFQIYTGGASVDTIALLNTNFPEGATWYANFGNTEILVAGDILYTNPGGPQPFRASPRLPGRPGYHSLLRLPAPVSFPWIRIVVDTGPIAGGLWHIEHVVVGLNRVTKNHALEKTETPVPMTSVDRTRSGLVDRVRGRPMRKVDFELGMLTEAQYETVYGDLWRYENEAVLCAPNSRAGAFLHDRLLFGELTGGRIVNPASPRYTRSFTINSII